MRTRTFASLGERNYALFYAGQILSLTGAWTEKPALQDLAYELTGQDEKWISWIGVLPLFPTLLVAIPAGHHVDRRDPWRIVVWTQTLMMLGAGAMAACVYAGVCTKWHVAAYTIYTSAVFAVDASARQSMLVQLVPRERLANAVALNASMFSVARFVGGAAYAAIVRYTSLGNVGCIALNAVSFAFVIGGLLLMRLPPRAEKTDHHDADAWEGVRYAWRTPEVRAALLLICVLSMFGFQISNLFVVYAHKVFDVGRPGLGDLHTATGLGAFLGSLALATRAADVHRGKLMLAYVFVSGLCLAAFSLTPPFGAALVILGLGGFLMTQAQSAGNSILQHAVPDGLRGRVMSLYVMCVLASFPLGALVAGLAAAHFGAPSTTMADAAIVLVAATAIAVTHPALRRAR
jgi:predicted MFS family arabinose efflux permease